LFFSERAEASFGHVLFPACRQLPFRQSGRFWFVSFGQAKEMNEEISEKLNEQSYYRYFSTGIV